MGQVPGRASLLLIGDGRLAGHLSFYLRAKELPLSMWSRRRDPRRTLLPGLLQQADRVLLAIRDDALAGFVREHRRDGGPLWVHFSGSAAVDGAWSAHPLCTFSGPPYEKGVYETIPFIVEREGPPLAELIPGLGNPSAAVPRAAKPLYHALCVAAGNFTQLLWRELFRGFEERLGLPAELALPYLRQTAHALERGLEDHLGNGVLTGPIARRDTTTIGRNLQALSGAGLDGLAGVYEAFLRLAYSENKPAMEVAA
jgi:predicted short-subunit dehydrogenase-like oxidoreductase (DUF2520 family)